MRLVKWLGSVLFCLSMVVTNSSFAEVTVVDYSSSTPENSSNFRETSGGGVMQRLSKLENQLNNINKQGIGTKVEDLQERLQKIMGQIEEQAHQIEQLKEQLRNFYQDLDRRVEMKKSSIDNTKDEHLDAVSQKSFVPEKTEKDIDDSAAKEIAPASADTAYLQEQQAYQTAIDLLPDRKYEASANKLIAYIDTYPKGAYIASAHYWLGEIYFLQKKYDEAKSEFKIVLTKYPSSKKVADAMLKIAFIDDMQGNHEQAVNGFKQIKKRYPNSAAAQLAIQQLQTMSPTLK